MTFNPTEALLRGKLAAACYLDWPECERLVRSLGYTKFRSFAVGSTEAFVAANDVELIYCFRGTDSIPDWIKNVKFRLRTFNGKQAVHRGFHSAVVEIGGLVRTQLSEWWAPGLPVVGIGHSLGAAANVIFSASFAAGLDPTVWLFGCPRVGNRHFAREYNFKHGGKTWRVVNENDAVPRVPGRLMGYRHVGRMAYFNWRGKLIEEPGVWRRFWNQVIGRAWAYWTRKDWHNGITRHLMHGGHGYLSALEGIA